MSLMPPAPILKPPVSVSVTLFALTTRRLKRLLPALLSVTSFAAPAVMTVLLAATVVIAPACVIAPLEIRVRFCAAVTVPSASGVLSVSEIAFAAPVLLSETVLPKLLVAVASVIAPFVAVNEAAPVTLNAPLCVTFPPVVTVRRPLIVEAPRSSAFVSLSVTALPLTMATVPKLFATASSVTLLPKPAVIEVVPGTTSVPLSETRPAAVTVRPPVSVTPAKSMAPVSLKVALAPFTTVTLPPKLFAASSVMLLPAPGVSEVEPVTEILPLSVIAPADVSTRFPVIATPPKSIAPVSLRVAFAPFTIVTAPPKLFALSSVMLLPAPGVREVVPVMERLPLSVMAPAAMTVRFCPSETVPRPIALMSVTEALFAPEFESETAPVKLFDCVSVIAAAPAV